LLKEDSWGFGLAVLLGEASPVQCKGAKVYPVFFHGQVK
jgi:hypothetical protein